MAAVLLRLLEYYQLVIFVTINQIRFLRVFQKLA